MIEWLIILLEFLLKSLRVFPALHCSNGFLYLKKYHQKCLYISSIFFFINMGSKTHYTSNQAGKDNDNSKMYVVFFQ